MSLTATQWLVKFGPKAEEQAQLDAYLQSRPNDWEINDVLKANYLAYVRALKLKSSDWGLGENDELLNHDAAMHAETFPRSSRDGQVVKDLGALMKLFCHQRSNRELLFSGQAGGTVASLRSRGFVFRQAPGNQGTILRLPDKTQVREIYDYDKSQTINKHSWDKLNPELREGIRRIFDNDLLGLSGSVEFREIDHRMPEAARKRVGESPIPLTIKSLEDKSWILHYQVLTKKTNNIKRQRCESCLDLHPIQLPPMLRPFRRAYKEAWVNIGKDSCLGCVWYDELRPAQILGPAHLVGLSISENERQVKLDLLVEFVKNWKAAHQKKAKKLAAEKV